jgi:quinol monooxygenase YgiN
VTEPIVFISHNRIKPGKLDALKAFIREGAKAIDVDKPGTVAFLAYADEEGTEVDIVHIFPDADAMDAHMEGVQERVGAAADYIVGAGVEIYGTPSERVLQIMREYESDQEPLAVQPTHLGGYLRLRPD